MAIDLSNRTKILAGVVVLAAAGAGAWFFLFQDEAPPPRTVVSTPASAPQPAAKSGEQAKAGDAPKAADAGKPADAAKTASAAPAAAPAAPPAATAAVHAAAKPIPTNPDKLIAEVIESSGIGPSFQRMGGELARSAVAGDQATALSDDDKRALKEAMERAFEPRAMTAELSSNLKANLDAERLSRFLEILRQPIALKMTAEESIAVRPEELKAFTENMRKSPAPATRVKLIQAVDDVTRSSEVASEMIGAMAREMFDAMLAELQKAGKKVPKESRDAVARQQNSIRNQARGQALTMVYFTYRNVSDEDLAAYVKLLDTDTGRWGIGLLIDAVRPVFTGRFGALGKDIARIALAKRIGAMAKAPAAEAAAPPLPKAETEAPAQKQAAAPAEPVGYRRPANIRELYTRYNDLISATVMRDRAAVKELLDDGKPVNVRQADGMTPLMIAVGNGDADIATMLLQKGADPNLRAAGGRTALSIAKSHGNAGAGLIPMLQASGAKE